MLPTLDILHQYKNPDVIERFIRNFPDKKDQAEDLFSELLNYLWLCQKFWEDKNISPHAPQLQFNCVMQQEMLAMDEMWHTFILFTQDYTVFCEKYFG